MSSTNYKVQILNGIVIKTTKNVSDNNSSGSILYLTNDSSGACLMTVSGLKGGFAGTGGGGGAGAVGGFSCSWLVARLVRLLLLLPGVELLIGGFSVDGAL